MRRLKIILLAVVLPIVVIGASAGLVAYSLKQMPSPVRTGKVQRGDVLVSVRETGVVQPIKSVEVKSKVAGLVAELAVEEGDRVQKGQLIARLDVPELRAQRDQVQAQLDAARARLAQARVTDTRDREVIAAGLRQAEANLRGAESALKEAQTRRLDAERVAANKRRLFAMGGYVPQSEVDSAQAAADLALQQEQSAQERIAEQQAARAAAKARQSEAELGKSRVAEAEASVRQIQDSLAEIETRLSDAVIVAPCSGVVIARQVRAGELITAVSYYGAGAPIVTIGDLSTMLVKASLNEVDIDKVHLGQSVKITADALAKQTFRGRVTRISPASVVDDRNQGIVKFPVEITVAGTHADLKTGMTANVEIACQRAARVLWVTNDAVFEKRGKSYVTVVTGEKTPKPTKEDREVKTGLANDARTEIRSGVKEGEKVELGKSAIPERKKINIQRQGGQEE
jgi:HlyD family secretion protein